MPILPLGFDPFGSMRISMAWPLKPSLAATMIAVIFVDTVGPNKAGETARFLPEDAAALVALIFPAHVARVRTFMTRRPGLSSLTGLAVLLGFAPLCFLLGVTLIGLPLIPILVFGVTVSALWLGERVPSLRDPTPTVNSHCCLSSSAARGRTAAASSCPTRAPTTSSTTPRRATSTRCCA
jgi:hypothetical protein